jgi:hypothetical protein
MFKLCTSLKPQRFLRYLSTHNQSESAWLDAQALKHSRCGNDVSPQHSNNSVHLTPPIYKFKLTFTGNLSYWETQDIYEDLQQLPSSSKIITDDKGNIVTCNMDFKRI